jgi:hypothetical protein
VRDLDATNGASRPDRAERDLEHTAVLDRLGAAPLLREPAEYSIEAARAVCRRTIAPLKPTYLK